MVVVEVRVYEEGVMGEGHNDVMLVELTYRGEMLFA